MKKKLLLFPLIICSVGTAIWLFITLLALSITYFQKHWVYLIALLPVVSLAYAYVDHFKKMHRLGNTESLLQEVRDPRKPVHPLLAPWIFVFTIVFHFFGASVGRESTAVQMGASIAETLGRILRIPVEDRPLVIRMGFAAGFGAAFGVPWAGAVFALESPLLFRRQDWTHGPFYVLCSWGAHQWALTLGLHHLVWQNLDVGFWQMPGPSFLILTLFFVFLALSYEWIFRQSSRMLKRTPWWLRSVAAGLLILVWTLWVGAPTFNNLGTSLIMESFEKGAHFSDALTKLGFTWISTVSGMKGGEVTPLMASGALFGSWFANLLSPTTFQLGTALGLVSLFTSRLRIPFTGVLMLWELFDWKIALLGAPSLLLIEYGHRKLASRFF